jgi:hypothetical protein
MIASKNFSESIWCLKGIIIFAAGYLWKNEYCI